MLGIEQKKGNDENLCGRMIAYARILPNPDNETSGSPFDDMIKNGILTLEGDFRQSLPTKSQRRALSDAMDEKFDNMLERMESEGIEIPENVDVDKMRERLHELSNMEVIPIPARIGNFTSESEILEEDADIYYIGEFMGVGQAHYCLTTLPIYYQAVYREQARRKEMDFLNEALAQIETGEFVDTDDLQKDTEELFPRGVTLNTFVGDMGKLLNTRVIPFLLALESDEQYEVQIKQFYQFMKGYPVQADVKLIDLAIRDLRARRDNAMVRKLLELGCKKIVAVYNEDPRLADEIGEQIAKFADDSSDV
ncbi:hypothetical protein SAMN05720766_101314 [Fibrobacter sp. UWH9]|uniref:hypothetical protein n=1 Tax=unclassified Fibrobacter TaxID=2634177 RepID=UPI000911C23C|nr:MULTISPECIES: hypothetical protein [Fibrobacter]MCL4100476.1 hypothetical protein [Fibrobacter succinogenes]OWV12780.1 hypothetical protein B7992_08825 [Fibrobacter sp. UWH1]SHG36858.1 hypothetical protein SAMN05720766_101314 [Fibrobacter sp. UWH9]SHK16781.1 hypothetical protein SAMN05720765_10195 [Fibrobacter sp. UWH6]